MRARILCLVLLAVLVGAAPAAARELPLGPGWLQEARTASEVAPGVTYTRIERGFPSTRDVFVVDVDFTSTRAEARELRRTLRDSGYPVRVERVRKRAPDDPQPGPLGYLVRVGAVADEAAAMALRDELGAAGHASARVVFTGEDGGRTTGPGWCTCSRSTPLRSAAASCRRSPPTWCPAGSR